MRRFQRMGRFLGFAVSAALIVALVPAGQQSALAAPGRPAAPPDAAVSGDVAVSGLGESDGYHLYEARSSDQWSWRPLAILAPGGDDGERWTGQQCVTGDGRTVVAVVAPWHAVNSPAGKDRGGTAIAVDLATGKERVLASDVALYYFNPGCGVGSYVTLTRYLGVGQQVTQVLRASATTGKVAQTETVDAEVTSAVPVDDLIVAAKGDQLVRLADDAAAPLATLQPGAFDLRPNAAGGVDLLTYNPAKGTTAWRWSGKLARLSASTRGQVILLSGGAGRTVLAGPGTIAAPAAGLSVRSGLSGELAGISLDGSVELVAPPKKALHAAELLPGLQDSSGRLVRAPVAAPDLTTRPKATAQAVPMVAAVPVDRHAALGGASVPSRDAAIQKAAVLAATTAPACAIPRDDLNIQVPQPSNDQVNWAVRESVINALPSRPAGFDNMPTASYSPEADFPQPVLNGTSTAGAHVPEVLVDAILAQESNWNQASWHAAPGLVGDPLTADYYGEGGDLTQPIDYTKSDCGYGLGQMTTIMFANAYNFSVQERVAVDYTENIAAVVQLLANTWNQLQYDGITVNSSNPNWLENWYDTIWAYNSGVEPNAANGNTTGCSPSPNCTDSAGNWGLGWANNPINPVYPTNRPVFLSDSYADASHPGEWPYQELIFGWMATALLRVSNGGTNGVPAYSTTYQFLQQPSLSAFCSTAVGYNNCNPSDPGGQYCLYQSGSLAYHCWWHQPVTFAAGCPAGGNCTVAGMTETPGQSEPPALDPQPPVCGLDHSQVAPENGPVALTVVTDEAIPAQDPENSDVNLVGCPATPSGWSQGGTFSMTNVWDSSGNPLHGQSDFHQLGAGFGGHMWFTHQVASGDASNVQNQVTGTWTPNLSSSNPNGGAGTYAIYVFVPSIGASANAVYSVNTNYSGRPAFTATVNQNNASGWVPIGFYYLAPGASVSLSNVASSASTADLAFNAVAFDRLTQAGTKGWVALGDSYSSGEGAPPFYAGTDEPGVNMCHRSSSTYSEQAWELANYSGDLAMTACSGAASDNLQVSDRFTEGPQWAALGGTTSLVTLTMGGNDLNFAGILNDCVVKTFQKNADCQGHWPDLDADIATEESVLIGDYRSIHEQAPNAAIVVLTYPDIFPANPNSGNCIIDANLTDDDVAWLYSEAQKLDNVIEEAVGAAAGQYGVPVSYLDEETAFNGHDVCSTSPWVNAVGSAQLVQAIVSGQNPSVVDQFFHPNQAGYAREASDLATYLVQHGLAH